MNSVPQPVILTLNENILKKRSTQFLYKTIYYESFERLMEEIISLNVPMRRDEQFHKEIAAFITNKLWKSTTEIKSKRVGNNYP